MRKPTMSHLGPLALLSLALALPACGGGALEADYPLEVVARAEGVGVEGVTVKLNDEEVGQTDEEGRFEGTFHGTEGEEITLEIVAPDDFRLAEDAEGTFKATLSAEHPEDGDPSPKTVSFGVDLKPTSLDYVVMVEAPGKYRPIYMGEELKGRTNSRGSEIVYFRGRPGSSVEVRVDTRSKKYSPLVKKFTLDEKERILTLDKTDEVTETEDEKTERAEIAAKREQEALERLAEKARKRGGRSAAKAEQAMKARPKEAEEADAEDLGAIAAVSAKAAEVAKRAPATPAPAVAAAAPPVAEGMPFDKKQAAGIVKTLAKDVAGLKKLKKTAAGNKAKLAKLKKKPAGEAVVERYGAEIDAAVQRIDQAIEAASAAQKAAAAAAKAKDMTEVLTQERAGKLALSDAEAAAEDAARAATTAAEEADRSAAEAKAAAEAAKAAAEAEAAAAKAAAEEEKRRAVEQEAQVREETVRAVDDATGQVNAALAEVKTLAGSAKSKAKGAKKGKKEAAGFTKDINNQGKALAKEKKGLAALAKKVKKAKAEALPGLKAEAEQARGRIDEFLGKAKAAMAQLEAAIADTPPPPAPVEAPAAVVAAAAPEAAPPVVAKRKGGKGGKGATAAKGGKEDPKKTKCPDDLECDLEELKSGLEDGSADRCLVAVCEKVPVGGANAEDIHLSLAKYWGRKKKRARQLKALEKATSFGQYKYDPNVLYGYIKVAVAARKFEKAIEIKDRFMQVKDRLPVAERKAKISEVLSILAQAYEHEFYRKQEQSDDQDFTPLLNKAVQFWEEYGSYSGDEAKAKKRIEELKKLREEIVQ